MKLFNFTKKPPKPYDLTTTLKGNTAKGRQDLLSYLLKNHESLSIHFTLNGGTLGFAVEHNRKTIGTLDSKVSRMIEEKYTNSAGLSCDLKVKDYKITSGTDGNLSCTIILTIIPE